MFTREQVERVKARREQEAAEKAAQVPAQPPKRVDGPERPAEHVAAAPASLAPPAPALIPDYELTLGTVLTLRELTDRMAARGLAPTPDLPFAVLTLAAMMLTDDLAGKVSRERFVELATAAYERAQAIAQDDRGKA